jgi:hypothetical protein
MWKKLLALVVLMIFPMFAVAQSTTRPSTQPASQHARGPQFRRMRPLSTTAPASRPYHVIPRGTVTSIDDESITILPSAARDNERRTEKTYPLMITTQVTYSGNPTPVAGGGVRRMVNRITANGGATIADIKVGQQVMLLIDDAGGLRMIAIMADPPNHPTTQPEQTKP